MKGNGSLISDREELSAIRKILERSQIESSHAQEEIEAMLAELRSLKHPNHSPATRKAS